MPAASIPIFPLPDVVLFPDVFLPLHIFEPRYRQMFAEALAGERRIGMVLLQPGYEPDYDGSPPVYAAGCAGLITHAERLEDGRYNVVLRGVEKFEILGEEPPVAGRLYRTALITGVNEALGAGDGDELRRLRRQLAELLAPLWPQGLAGPLPADISDEALVNALAQYLALEPIEKLALLQQPGAVARGRSLIELLEMKALRSFNSPDTIH